MRTIHFKNGKRKKVAQHIVNKLTKKLQSKEGSRQFQAFSEGDKGEEDCLLMINVHEINYID